jgi:hypothetical protein
MADPGLRARPRATIVPNESAVGMLSSTRCAYEQTCGHVGTGMRFANAQECSNTADLDVRSAIGLDACPFGVDGDALRRCTDALRAHPCEFPISTVDHIAQCRRSELCW